VPDATGAALQPADRCAAAVRAGGCARVPDGDDDAWLADEHPTATTDATAAKPTAPIARRRAREIME
jgi:hypothetical protein